MSPGAKVRCHYEVLGVERDADASTIKKAHRKLALRYHPDKNQGCKEAEHEFRLVQEAYECLSDPAERRWFDEHRESVLRGGKGFDDGGGGGDDGGISFIFDVIPYHFAGCYDGYGDDQDGFFAVYAMVFGEVLRGEQNGWVSEGNIDEEKMPNRHLAGVDFGDSSSEWADVSSFYGAWESYSSCLSFAWADKYDPREAPNRRVRRAIDDENRKARRAAKRERNDDVLSLVHFVKRRDPRVKEAKERAEQERIAREAERAKELQRKKADAAVAREEWRAEAEKAMATTEADDVQAGRIRLADLDDSDDDFYGGGKKGRKKKKKKGKKGKKNRNRWSDDDDDDDDEKRENESSSQQKGEVPSSAMVENENEPNALDDKSTNNDSNLDAEVSSLHEVNEDDVAEQASQQADPDVQEDFVPSEDESEEEEEEPEFWRCECCRKDFKSEKQLENHIKSKKHREAWKKYEKRMKKELEAKEDEVLEDMLDGMQIN